MAITINGSTGVTFPAGGTGNTTGAAVGTSDTQTLSNKTFSGAQTFGTASLAEPSGSAPLYMCRAWVNFDGTGTVAIRASGNVSSITDNNVGDYTVNFTSAMPDANYSPSLSGTDALGNWGRTVNSGAITASSLRVYTTNETPSLRDFFHVYVAIFR